MVADPKMMRARLGPVPSGPVPTRPGTIIITIIIVVIISMRAGREEAAGLSRAVCSMASAPGRARARWWPGHCTTGSGLAPHDLLDQASPL